MDKTIEKKFKKGDHCFYLSDNHKLYLYFKVLEDDLEPDWNQSKRNSKESYSAFIQKDIQMKDNILYYYKEGWYREFYTYNGKSSDGDDVFKLFGINCTGI